MNEQILIKNEENKKDKKTFLSILIAFSVIIIVSFCIFHKQIFIDYLGFNLIGHN